MTSVLRLCGCAHASTWGVRRNWHPDMGNAPWHRGWTDVEPCWTNIPRARITCGTLFISLYVSSSSSYNFIYVYVNVYVYIVYIYIYIYIVYVCTTLNISNYVYILRKPACRHLADVVICEWNEKRGCGGGWREGAKSGNWLGRGWVGGLQFCVIYGLRLTAGRRPCWA